MPVCKPVAIGLLTDHQKGPLHPTSPICSHINFPWAKLKINKDFQISPMTSLENFLEMLAPETWEILSEMT